MQGVSGRCRALLKRVEAVFADVLSRYRREIDVVVVRFVNVLVSFDMVLRSAADARSRKAVLKSDSIHVQLDQVLDLLAPLARDSVHEWRHIRPQRERLEKESRQLGMVADHESESSDTRAPLATSTGAVRIVHIESARANERFPAPDMSQSGRSSGGDSAGAASDAGVPIQPSRSGTPTGARQPWPFAYLICSTTRVTTGSVSGRSAKCSEPSGATRPS